MIELGNGYTAERIPDETYREASTRSERVMYSDTSVYAFDAPTRADVPKGETYSWGIFHGGQLVGWHHAYQYDERSVYMSDSGLLPEHRGQGVYTRLLPSLLEAFRAAGYTLIRSHHRATNNAVIIPKLRLGFFIQGLNLYEGGVNVLLVLSFDESYRAAQRVRSGELQPRGEVARRLGLPQLDER